MKDKGGKRKKVEFELQVMRKNVAGADIGSREHWICAPAVQGEGCEVERFGSTTAELYRMAQWMKARGVKSVAMESTSVYWISVFEVLDRQGFEVILVNARCLMSVPGRKTDVLDCQWIQKLHSCGLLKGSFRPADGVCALRALVRERATLISQQSDWIRRMQKAFDQMNIRLHHAVADISGTTGMAIVRAIVKGERDPKRLAEFRDARCKKSSEEIIAYLQGNWRDEHLFNLEQALKMYDFLGERMDAYDAAIMQALQRLEQPELQHSAPPALPTTSKMRTLMRRGQEPMREALYRLNGVDLLTIDAIGAETAETVLSEFGWNLSTFPTERHFVSYLRLSPKLAISGGKPLRGKRRQSTATRVGTALRTAASTLRHSKTALGAEYRRLARIKGPGVAVFAMARRLAVLIYRLLKHGQAYVDQGMKVYEERFQQRKLAACQNMAKSLGFGLVMLPQTAT